MVISPLGCKILAALALMILTFLSTLFPYKIKNSSQICIKNVSCFCGGLFVGLCFLHLIPDALKDFASTATYLGSIQKGYPLAEFIMCLGMIIVMVAEKSTTAIQNWNDERRKCSSSKDCCKDTCRREGRSSLYGSLNLTQGLDEDINLAQTDIPSGEDVLFVDNGEREGLVQSKENETSITLTTSLTSQLISNKESRTTVIKTICLIIALMIHSLFEGLTVGLQKTTYGIVALVAVLAFHKSIIGFSLGIAIVNTNKGLKFHIKQAVLFALASPFGIMVGAFLLSARFNIFNQSALSVLICLATGTFLYITFFEILGKNLGGTQSKDMVAFTYFIIGFGIFAGLTAIPGMQE